MWNIQSTLVYCKRKWKLQKVKVTSWLAIMMLTTSEIMIQEDQVLNMFLELGLEQFLGVVKDNQLYHYHHKSGV